MVLRPPGAPGGSKTSYTAYIFGGFDGYEHNDMVNITINVYPIPAANVNRCRGKLYIVGLSPLFQLFFPSPVCLSIFKVSHHNAPYLMF